MEFSSKSYLNRITALAHPYPTDTVYKALLNSDCDFSLVSSVLIRCIDASKYLSMRNVDARNVNADSEWAFGGTFFELLIAEHATGVGGCGHSRGRLRSTWSGRNCISTRDTSAPVVSPPVLLRNLSNEFP